MRIPRDRYYAFFAVEGGVSTQNPVKYSCLDFARRGIRKEAKAHLPEGGNAAWSIHLPSGKTLAAGGWKNGAQFRAPDAELHLYDKPEIE